MITPSLSTEGRPALKILVALLAVGLLAVTAFPVSSATAGPGSREVLIDRDNNPSTPPSREFAGSDRYWTSLFTAGRYLINAFEADNFPNAAIIASGESLIDAAAAAGLARSANAPVLLTPSHRVFEPAAHLIEAADIERIFIIGGTSAISPQVEATLRNIPGVTSVTRVGGEDRYQTAAFVAYAIEANNIAYGIDSSNDFCGNRQRSAILVSGDSFPGDLIVAGPMSYAFGIPILLYSTTNQNLLTLQAEIAIDILGITNVVQIGTAAHDFNVNSMLASLGIDSIKIAGRSTFSTSVAVSSTLQSCLGRAFDSQSAALINVEAFADGISAAPVLGQGLRVPGRTTPALLVRTGSLPNEIHNHLRSNPAAVGITAIGGEAVVSSNVVAAAVRSANSGVTTTTTSSTTTTTTLPVRRNIRIGEHSCEVRTIVGRDSLGRARSNSEMQIRCAGSLINWDRSSITRVECQVTLGNGRSLKLSNIVFEQRWSISETLRSSGYLSISNHQCRVNG